MIIFRALSILVLAFAVAGCSPAGSSETVPFDSGAPTSTAAPSTTVPASTTTTTTTLPTHAVGYPEVPVSMRKLDEDEISYVIWTRSEQEQDKDVPEFVYGNDFTPSNMDLDPPRPVQFTNSTEDDIIILFGTGDAPDLAVAAGATETLDFSSLPEEIYRFHVFRGNAKISGFVDMRPLESSIEPTLDDTSVRQAPFNGRFSVAVPKASSWYFNPQYDSIVAVPIGDDWVQGDFQWSLATGAALVSSGMRLSLADLDDPAAVLEDPSVPENCSFVAAEPVDRAGFVGNESTYDCGRATLFLGVLEAGEDYLVYALADATADPVDVVVGALESIELHSDGSGVAITERELPVHIAYSWLNGLAGSIRYGNRDGPYPIDIEGGDISTRLAATLSVLSPTEVELRNFDDVSYDIEVNGRSVVELPSRHAASFDIVDFGEDIVHFVMSAPPFVGYGLTVDVSSRKPAPPEVMYFDTGRVRRETISAGMYPMAEIQGIQALELQVPVGWVETGDPDYWEFRYARQAADDDPAEVEFVAVTGRYTDVFLDEISVEARVLPELVDRVVIRGWEWGVYQWAPPGHPTVTLLALEENQLTVSYAKLTSAPEDHATLYEQALLPLMRDMVVTLTE
ncbi:MAG: hypothetical protein GY722_10480 [bacterium]|nr:hypothetical protein [bacterium]